MAKFERVLLANKEVRYIRELSLVNAALNSFWQVTTDIEVAFEFYYVI